MNTPRAARRLTQSSLPPARAASTKSSCVPASTNRPCRTRTRLPSARARSSVLRDHPAVRSSRVVHTRSGRSAGRGEREAISPPWPSQPLDGGGEGRRCGLRGWGGQVGADLACAKVLSFGRLRAVKGLSGRAGVGFSGVSLGSEVLGRGCGRGDRPVRPVRPVRLSPSRGRSCARETPEFSSAAGCSRVSGHVRTSFSGVSLERRVTRPAPPRPHPHPAPALASGYGRGRKPASCSAITRSTSAGSAVGVPSPG